MIKIVNLSKTYEQSNQKFEALKNINLTISDGDIFGIMGLSGAGKSSLLRCINLLEKPTSGHVLIDNIDITKLNGKHLRNFRKNIGMIFQQFNLLMNLTVFENIAFPLKISNVHKSEIEEKVNKLLQIVDLKDKKNSYPSQLSGGQKQRVAIARALATNPKIILCDEATSALDPQTTQSILSLLKSINEEYKITIIVVTHEMSVIKNLCRNVAVIEDGQIAEIGSVVEVFSNPKSKTSKKFTEDIFLSSSSSIVPNGKLLKLTFIGDDAQKPIISNMVKNFNVDANIISGNIDIVQNIQLGSLIINLSGEKEDIKKAENYLKEHKLTVEVIENGIC